MPVFMWISKHAPENCPVFSPKHRKSTIELFEKAEALEKKHGIKILGSWTDFPQHIVYHVMEGSLDAMRELLMEPVIMEWLSFNTMEIKTLIKDKEALQMLKQAK
jgi:hypothetical protein